jgi:hypothetical protein
MVLIPNIKTEKTNIIVITAIIGIIMSNIMYYSLSLFKKLVIIKIYVTINDI